ncbi:MAG TPA: GIY-YIG nuclease family protein [Steroidobacteraceae bacterium]|nr:GIY-YIG nuclease family protein [Steroidobacteraceae bacterium]
MNASIAARFRTPDERTVKTSLMKMSSQSDMLPLYDSDESEWFVYVLPLAGGAAFKVGFSCHPLQRFYAFTRRYFERFDLHRALLLRVTSCDDARRIEALLKASLAAYRANAPVWSLEAGGHTEWFRVDAFDEAEQLLGAQIPTIEAAQLIDPLQHLHRELSRMSQTFAGWAYAQACQIRDAWEVADRGWPAPYREAQTLRDWLDAYRFFDVSLLPDDPEMAEFIRRCAHVSA